MGKAVEKKRKKPSVFRDLISAFRRGSYLTRLSFFISGFGQIARGQIAKGFLYMATQAAFLLFMIFFGGRYIAHLFQGIWAVGFRARYGTNNCKSLKR